MKISYIPPKGKAPLGLSLYNKMYSTCLLSAGVMYELYPKSQEIVEVITDGDNNVKTITTVLQAQKIGGPVEVGGGVGVKELIIVIIVATGAYFIREMIMKDKETPATLDPKKKAEAGEFDMSIFDKTGE